MLEEERGRKKTQEEKKGERKEKKIGKWATQYRRCFSTTNSEQLHGGAPPKFLTSNTHGEEGGGEQRATAWERMEGGRMQGWEEEETGGVSDCRPGAMKATQNLRETQQID